MDLIVGLLAALALIFVLSRLPPAQQLAGTGIGLVIAAAIYVAFALWRGPEWFGFELVGLATFTLLAAMAVRYSPWFVAAGWALHVPWDLFVHHGGPAYFVPSWYPGACLAFDMVIALWAARCTHLGQWKARGPVDWRRP